MITKKNQFNETESQTDNPEINETSPKTITEDVDKYSHIIEEEASRFQKTIIQTIQNVTRSDQMIHHADNMLSKLEYIEKQLVNDKNETLKLKTQLNDLTTEMMHLKQIVPTNHEEENYVMKKNLEHLTQSVQDNNWKTENICSNIKEIQCQLTKVSDGMEDLKRYNCSVKNRFQVLTSMAESKNDIVEQDCIYTIKNC